jgi:phosphinothricin acetyltransferase
MGITNLYACIGVPADEADEYLDNNSMDFHMHMGYSLAGRFYKCGYKFGRWYDMVWLEKIISEHGEDLPGIINYPDIKYNVKAGKYYDNKR